MTRELWTLETRKQRIIAQAAAIAGSAWNDRMQVGSLSEQLRQVAYGSRFDEDCDLTDPYISGLVSLAREAEELGL